MNPKGLRSIYDYISGQGEMPAYDEWLERVAFFYETDNGGLALVRDTKTPEVWWVQVYCPHEFPKKPILMWCIRMAYLMGCGFLAVKTGRRGMERIIEGLGFQRLEKGLYSLKLKGGS